MLYSLCKDFSKIEAGKLQLQNEQFNPESAIEVVCEILSIMAVTKDIELVFLVHPGVPPLLHGDPLRLRQVLMNLVGMYCKKLAIRIDNLNFKLLNLFHTGNAIKFTASGEVIVECSLIETHADQATLLFTVQVHIIVLISILICNSILKDTGCGMTPDDQKSLFNAFYQVDPSITRTHGGTGPRG
jgi:two-component system sensor histidine kinase/response regulator